MPVVLRRQQIEAADAVEAAFRAGVKRPLVDMCVASGKSLTFAELARREIARGGRAIIGAHVRELVQQNAKACRDMGLQTGINAEALGERTWRAPVICAGIQSVFRNAASFGPITLLAIDEAHLVPHAQSGMYRELHRALGYPRLVGGSGTVFRLQGGSLIEGEESPFDAVVYRYSILDGIHDGYLCPAFSAEATDRVDRTKLKTRSGEYTSESSDAQMLAAMDNHIEQMVHHGWRDRRAWLVFEAGTKSATAMAERMNAWGIPTGLVLGTTPAGERAAIVEAFRAGRLRALVNINALCVGFDVPQVDFLIFRRPTKSVGLYIQQAGRGLRCVGGNIEASIAAGKSDCMVLDFAGNIDTHGPLDFITIQKGKPRLVSCDACGARCQPAASRCWKCDAIMLKNCPACLQAIAKRELDCPACGFDMRTDPAMTVGAAAPKLLDTPTGAALIRTWAKGSAREGGWIPVRRAWTQDGVATLDDADGGRWPLPATLASYAPDVRWIRAEGAAIGAVLLPNGSSRTSALQVALDGRVLVVPLPAAREAA